MKSSSFRFACMLGIAAALWGCSTGSRGSGIAQDGGLEDGGLEDGRGLEDGGGVTDAKSDVFKGPGDGDGARVFVTATTYAPQALGGGATGFAGADGFCANAAAAAGLDGRWVAWLSTTRTDAIERVTGDGPWYLVDRKTLVFLNHASLATVPRVGIGMNELGVIGQRTNQVWTGTANGGMASPNTCAAWSSGANNQKGMTGIGGQKDEWTTLFEETCDREQSLYCFELK
jgi:hypothetical protein